MSLGQKLFYFSVLFVFSVFVQTTFSYELIMDRVEQVGTKDFVDSSSIKIRKDGKDRKVNGKFIVVQPLNDSVILKLHVSKKTGSGWNILPFKVEKPICTFFKDDQYFYPDLVKSSTFPDPMPCPIPAEAFELKGWYPSLEQIPPMLLKHGDYKVDLAFVLGSTEVFTAIIYATLNNMMF